MINKYPLVPRTSTPPIQNKIVTEARNWLATSFLHQGRLKKTDAHLGGVDCIGLIMGVAKELNIKSKAGEPLCNYDETNYSFYPDGVSLKNFLDRHLIKLKDVAQIDEGDIILFKFHAAPQHVGIVSRVNYNKDDHQAKDYNEGKDENYFNYKKNNNSLQTRSNLNIIHCYLNAGRVTEHPLSPAWRRMIVAGYRFVE